MRANDGGLTLKTSASKLFYAFLNGKKVKELKLEASWNQSALEPCQKNELHSGCVLEVFPSHCMRALPSFKPES